MTRMTVKGVTATDTPGQERHEWFGAGRRAGRMVQYDYRAYSGELFSGVFRTLADARAKRDAWVRERGV